MDKDVFDQILNKYKERGNQLNDLGWFIYPITDVKELHREFEELTNDNPEHVREIALEKIEEIKDALKEKAKSSFKKRLKGADRFSKKVDENGARIYLKKEDVYRNLFLQEHYLGWIKIDYLRVVFLKEPLESIDIEEEYLTLFRFSPDAAKCWEIILEDDKATGKYITSWSYGIGAALVDSEKIKNGKSPEEVAKIIAKKLGKDLPKRLKKNSHEYTETREKYMLKFRW